MVRASQRAITVGCRVHEFSLWLSFAESNRYEGDASGLPDDYNNLANDLVTIWKAAPKSLTVGGNTDMVNSFQGVNVSDLTGSAYRTQDLLDPAKASRFFCQLVLSAIPDFLGTQLLGTALETALNLLKTEVSPLVDPQCPRIGELPFINLFRSVIGRVSTSSPSCILPDVLSPLGSGYLLSDIWGGTSMALPWFQASEMPIRRRSRCIDEHCPN